MAVSHVVWWLAAIRIRQTQGSNLVSGSGVSCWELHFFLSFPQGTSLPWVFTFWTCCILRCLMCIVVSCLVCIVVVVLCILLSSYVYLLYYVCTAVFTLDAGLPARSQYSEGPATGHLDTGFSWFPCA